VAICRNNVVRAPREPCYSRGRASYESDAVRASADRLSRAHTGVLDPSAVTVGTTTITSRMVSVPSTTTPDDRERLLDFHARNGRWPEAGDGAIYDLLVRVEAQTDRAFVRAPRQPGESASAAHWRRTRASLRLRKRKHLGVIVRPCVLVRERGRARRGSRRTAPRRSRARSPGRSADDDPDPLDDRKAAA
jgi:hypothetical protein